MNLTFIEDGSRLLIDTNILIYARRGMSEQCRTLLRRCSAGQLFGALTTIGLAEFCHRRMMMEAQSRGLSSSNPSRSLSEDPKLVQQLSQYSGEVADLLSEELSIIEIEAIDFPKALEIQRAHGLMTNDYPTRLSPFRNATSGHRFYTALRTKHPTDKTNR